jgi:two-component system OmpR family response regulator
MTGLRILHVDDEPDIREVVEMSLELDPAFTVRSCSSGKDALAVAADWSPDLILCDVMMPVMDGPTTLIHLRESPQTAGIPVVFMTARAQPRELEQFKSLGASGVIPKPFDPLALATSVRGHLCSAGIAALREGFLKRLRTDAASLVKCRTALANDPTSPALLEQIRAFVHALAGAAGIFGFHDISRDAATLEKAVSDRDAGPPGTVERALDALLDCIERE